MSDSKAFVIAVFGCPDPDPPAHGYIKRDKDRVQIHCHFSEDDKWELSCHEGQWNGDVGNCSTGKLVRVGYVY